MDTLFQSIKQHALELQSQLVNWRRELHQFPELSFQEQKTKQFVIERLQQLQLDIVEDEAGYGFYADIHGIEGGPIIALRADMDALPIQEECELPFASTVEGVMHACGHDAHTTMLLGAAQIIAAHRTSFKGTIRLLFQAAEEVNAGAKSLIAAGALAGVSEIYGLHNLPTLSAGYVTVKSGSLMGSVAAMKIKLTGRGGHGAIPDQSIDPIVAAAAIVQGLQTIVSRELSPFQPVVITIGSIQAGQVGNVIPQYADMLGTVRSFDPVVQKQLPHLIKRVVETIAASYRCEVAFEYIDQTPVLVNDEQSYRIVKEVAASMLGAAYVQEAEPTLAGEDFSIYLQEIPGCFFWLGSGPAEDAHLAYGLHHPKFMLHEQCLHVGTSLLSAIAMNRLEALLSKS